MPSFITQLRTMSTKGSKEDECENLKVRLLLALFHLPIDRYWLRYQ